MNLNLENKNALVCGGSKGIGNAIAQELALLGATVTLVARNEQSLKEAVAKLDAAQNQTHDYMVADFADAAKLQTTLNGFLSLNNKTYHVLINNTGGPPGGSANEATIDSYWQAFNNHLICNQVLVQALLPKMKESGYGRIINVISTSVKAPLKGLGVSNTIRGAVANWSKTLANELGTFGITVNNVLPGATATGRLTDIINNKAKKQGISAEAAEKQMKSIIPLGRFALPNEVAAAAAFIASPAAAYISGTNIVVDGGRTPTL